MTTPKFTIDWPHGWATKTMWDAVILKFDAIGAHPLIGYVRFDGRCQMTGYELSEPQEIATQWDSAGINKDTHLFNLHNRAAPLTLISEAKLKYGYVNTDHNGDDHIVIFDKPPLADKPDRVAWFYAPEAEAPHD